MAQPLHFLLDYCWTHQGEVSSDVPPWPPCLQVLVLDPISVDEAIDAMEAVGHDFYVFRCGAVRINQA